jgi:hypothetical protein
VLLGVDPPSQEEEPVKDVALAGRFFARAVVGVGDLIDLLSPGESNQAAGAGTATYRPNTAFIMIAIDKGQLELEDIKNGIKNVCKEIGITGVTADEIEHEGAITDQVLDEIETKEFFRL